MIIAVDEAIPYWEEAFFQFGEIRLFSGRNPKPESFRDADALVVRSVTQVGASLLKGSSVRFVACASAGIDHVDQEYLRSRGIHFAYAAGCNADSVSEYIVAALHAVASRRNWDLGQKSLAIIGVGNVGSRVEKKACALGMEVLFYDPPLRDATGDSRYRPLDDVLEADILTYHVPLTSEGRYPTWHMVDRRILGHFSPRQFLINSARGAVFDCRELKAILQKGRIEGAVLDVWEGEPMIDYSLLDLVDIGTAHIAGGAMDGKIRATEMAREALCGFFGIHSVWNTASIFPDPRRIHPEEGTAGQDAVRSVLLQAYDILHDDASMRSFGVLPVELAATSFDQFRSDYPLRLGFSHFVVELAEQQLELADTFAALGFKVTPFFGEV